MSGLLFGVRPTDPLTFVVVSMVLLLVSVVASSLPAYRASTVDPVRTLRDQ
jgi:ABC-type lipoprotein release transport system permease subunit